MKSRVNVSTTLVLAVIAVFSAVAGWSLAPRTPSPESRPSPDEFVESVVVEQGPIEADVRFAVTRSPAKLSEVVLRSAPPGSGTVTRVFAVTGQELGYGSPILEIEGVPLLLFPGQFRFYRELKLGDSGVDVDQLWRGLAELGYASEASPGTAVSGGLIDSFRAMIADQGLDPSVFMQRPANAEPVTVIPSSALVVHGGGGTVSAVPAKVGSVVAQGDVLVTIGSESANLAGSVVSADVERLKGGAPVVLSSSEGARAEGRVVAVEPAPPSEGVGPGELTNVTIQSDDVSVLGSSTKIEASVERSIGDEKSVVVPAAAVFQNATGPAVVAGSSVEDADTVQVRLLGEHAGLAAVLPLEPGAVKPGDVVVRPAP